MLTGWTMGHAKRARNLFQPFFRRIFLVSLGCIHLSILGCAQNQLPDKPMSISPVSAAESRLIQFRINAHEPPSPYEQIELGKSSQILAKEDPVQTCSYWDEATHLSNLVQSIQQSTSEFFKAYPPDQAIFAKIQASIPKTRCFDDGEDIYCGPGLLSGALFLLDSSSWKSLHHWLGAIHKAMIPTGMENNPDTLAFDATRSAAFEGFVRYFVYGLFKPISQHSPLFSESHCLQMQEQLEGLGERAKINPCDLVLSHRKSKSSGRF